MKGRQILVSVLTLAVLLAVAGLSVRLSAHAEGQAQGPQPPEKISGPDAAAAPVSNYFTYQGFLKDGSAPANGQYDFRFDLYPTLTGVGSLLGSSYLYKTNVSVANGLFTVQLDFNSVAGKNLFTGDARYIEISVRHAGSGTYTPLTPRQELTAAPYALSLKPGAIISGTAYQNLKVQSNHPGGGIPAALTGEMLIAKDGVGVYGSHNNTAADAGGAGVWGRTWSPLGSGVEGTGYNGANGVKGTSDWVGVYGESSATANAVGVAGEANASGCFAGIGGCYGVQGISDDGYGVSGQTNNGVALYAYSAGAGVGLRVDGQGSGNLIEAHHGPMFPDRRFYVSNAGDVYADGTWHTPAADMAEMLPAVDELEPGDVLVVGVDGKLARSEEPYQASVVGVYSTKPGFVGGAEDGADLTGKVPLAIVGVVPVKVTAENGPIHPGDLLTTSSMPGHAMKAKPITLDGMTFYPSSVIIGKALGSLETGTGVIQILVTLQ